MSVLLIVVVAAFFRLYDIRSIPPGLYPDEAMDGNNALEVIQTGHFQVFYVEDNGREGLYVNTLVFFIKAFGNNHIDSSIFYFNNVINKKADYADAYNSRGLAYIQLGKFMEAKKDFLKAIDIKPEFPSACSNLAALLKDRLNDFEGAKQYYIKSIGIDSSDAKEYVNLANLLNEKFQDYKGAKDNYLKAIAILNDFQDAHYNLALLLETKLNDYNGAEKQYLEAIRINVDNKHAHLNLALIYKNHLNNKPVAKDHYVKATTDRADLIDAELDKYFDIER